MKTNKKITLGTLAAVATIAVPVATAVSCGKENKYHSEKVIKSFTATVNKSSIAKDGWGIKNGYRDYRVDKKGPEGKSNYSLTNEFVDYLVQEINTINLEESYKTFYLDFRYFHLDKLGSYFWDAMKTIKVNHDEVEFESDHTKLKGTSGILINVMHNNFADTLVKNRNKEDCENFIWRTVDIDAVKYFLYGKDESNSNEYITYYYDVMQTSHPNVGFRFLDALDSFDGQGIFAIETKFRNKAFN